MILLCFFLSIVILAWSFCFLEGSMISRVLAAEAVPGGFDTNKPYKAFTKQ